MKPLEIDGSMGEGGGQVLRYSLALSALTLRPVRVYNIRAKRDNPGLRPQHLTALKALGELTKAHIEGARIGSTEVYFEPQKRAGGELTLDAGTAGSISLMIQAILPVLLFSERDSTIRLIGGTDVEWSPPIDYMRFVFAHNLALMGAKVEIKLERRGHYPRGGGVVLLRVERLRGGLEPIHVVESGGLEEIRGVSHAVRLPRHVAERQALAAKRVIAEKLGITPEIELEYYDPAADRHLGPGSGIVLYASTKRGTRIGADSLGAKGKPAERVGEEAAMKLIEEAQTGMGFDRHMGDMLVPYAFLAKGVTKYGVSKLTLHALTAIEVSKLFFPEAEAKLWGELDKPSIIEVRGCSFSP